MCQKHQYEFNRYCGVMVCEVCSDHKGLARCYCGWSKTSPGRGAEELEEMGENLEDTGPEWSGFDSQEMDDNPEDC